MNNKVRNLTYTALLTALAIIIPLYFKPLRIEAGPFTATIASHVPMFMSMALGPMAAAVVGIGSTLGFLVNGSIPVVIARAAMHIIVGLVGGLLLKRGTSYNKMTVITAPIHGILEGLVLIPILGFNQMVYIVAVGTFVHHFVDAALSYVLVKALARSGNKTFVQNA